MPKTVDSYDAFSRLRVSHPVTMFDFDHVGVVNPIFDFSSNYTYDYSASTIELDSSGGRTSIAQTRYIAPYQPGKSLLFMTSFIMSDSNTSTERVGYFNQRNGVYFEKNNGTYDFTIRNETVDTSVAQSSWNERQLAAGETVLDCTKAQIFWIDLEWLGLGQVTCGFIVDGQLVPCHRFNHVNTNTAVYMKQAKLPARYEINESGSTTKSLKQVCGTILSEGGYELRGHARSVGNHALIAVGSNGTEICPLAVRLSSAHIDDTVVVPSSLASIVQASSATRGVKLELLLNPTISGDTTWLNVSGSVMQFTRPTLTPATGTTISTIYVESRGSDKFTDANEFNLQVGRALDGTSDILAVKATAINNNPQCAVALTWYEI